ncbi:hypothetical protein RI129_012909 [Pyrocoelia pectoralis]|uniref:Odorant receptor n=1 Tax=Pyrocoelia pectoralis TaxID=417401 RepID=A0AAN7V862_9COLE
MAILVQDVDQQSKRNEFALHKILLNCLGVKFIHDKTEIRKLHVIMLIFVVASYSFIELWELIANIDDFDIVTNIILHLIGILCNIVILCSEQRKIQKILEEMQKIPKMENSILDKKNIVAIKYCFGPLYVVFILSAIFSMSTRLIFADRLKWALPFTQITIINVMESPTFEIIWFQQTLAFIVATCAYLICEVMITSVLAHLCIHQYHYQNLSNGIIFAFKENGGKQSIEQCIEGLIVRHVGVYDWSSQIQEAFSLIVFVVFGSDVLIICFSAFHASLFPLTDAQCVRDLGIAVSVAVKTLIVCYYGNEVTLESESLTTACFHAYVHIWNRNYHKALLMIIKKSQKPIKIAAGNFIPISLKTFIWIIRSSYSYFAVLRNRNDALPS